MSLHTKSVHSGDRKRTGASVPVTTPIHTAVSHFYDDVETLDKVFAHEIDGPSYGRYSNQTTAALEKQIATLENGAGALATSSGMSAIHMALTAAIADRRRNVLAASALYGATIGMLTKVFEPTGVEVNFVDFNDLEAVAEAIAEHKPGALLMETVSNPLLRVAPLDKIAELAKSSGAALIVDATFSTPRVIRPLEYGATYVVHSLTKYFSGHGDVLGGVVIANEPEITQLHTLSRTVGFVLGPFESYLAMRGCKTFALRVERQCQNAAIVAKALAANPLISKVHFTGNPDHPDAETIARLFDPGHYGAMIAFEVGDGANAADRARIFRIMNALRMIVAATSLGDVHSMVLYPPIASHRDLSPKHRARLGIHDNLIRLSIGIEDPADIVADLDQALFA